MVPEGPTALSSGSSRVATRALCPFDLPKLSQLSGAWLSGPASNGLGWAASFQETGWGAAPEFLDLPPVSGNGPEIPPWPAVLRSGYLTP